MAVESVWLFWPQFAWETWCKNVMLARTVVALIWAAVAISWSGGSCDYADQALAPVEDGEGERLALFTQTSGGMAAADHQRKIERLTRRGAA